MAGVESNCRRRLSGYTTGLLAVTLALYFAGCCLPATDISSQWDDWGALRDSPVEKYPRPGWVHLAFGWMGRERELVPWSANLVLCVGIIALLRNRLGHAALLGTLAMALGLTTPTAHRSCNFYAGYFCWQGSLIVFASGAMLGWVLSQPRPATPECGAADEPT